MKEHVGYDDPSLALSFSPLEGPSLPNRKERSYCESIEHTPAEHTR